jgi:hypothetical protein
VVRFEYEPFPRYDLLLAIGVLTLLGLALLPGWFARRRERRSSRGKHVKGAEPDGTGV